MTRGRSQTRGPHGRSQQTRRPHRKLGRSPPWQRYRTREAWIQGPSRQTVGSVASMLRWVTLALACAMLLTIVSLLLLLLLMTFIGRKLRHAANAPSQPLHDYSYHRTGTFSVVSWTLAVKCSADGGRLEDCSTRLARERQNYGLRSLFI